MENAKEPITRYVEDRYAKLNEFVSMQPDMSALPDFENERDRLPEPVWAGHGDEIDAYYKAWEIAFRNLGKPTKESGFVSPYIDAAFNGHIFMWDSCFMLMFGKYGDSVHCFQKTLDNFYCKQHKDGFICREINELDGVDRFYRHDPTSTGPEIMAWCEWQYYKNYGDKERLKSLLSAALVPPLAQELSSLEGRELLVERLGLRHGQSAALLSQPHSRLGGLDARDLPPQLYVLDRRDTSGGDELRISYYDGGGARYHRRR